MKAVRIVLVSLGLLLTASVAGAVDPPSKEMNLCGWFVNPTPANAWLVDRSGEWIVSTQGGEEAEGDWPEFTARQWIRTNGNYGRGCACMRVVAEPASRRVVTIKSARAQSLAVCQRDRSLKTPP